MAPLERPQKKCHVGPASPLILHWLYVFDGSWRRRSLRSFPKKRRRPGTPGLGGWSSSAFQEGTSNLTWQMMLRMLSTVFVPTWRMYRFLRIRAAVLAQSRPATIVPLHLLYPSTTGLTALLPPGYGGISAESPPCVCPIE